MFHRSYFPGAYFPDDFFGRDSGTATGFISATLTGTAAVNAVASALGHLSADLSGTADVTADLEAAPAGFMTADLVGSSEFTGDASAIGHLQADLTGSALLTATIPAVAAQDDDSGGVYRRKGHVKPLTMPRLVLAFGRSIPSAIGAALPVQGRPLKIAVGRLVVGASATQEIGLPALALRTGYVRVYAAASAAAASMQVQAGSSPVQAHAAALARVAGFSLLARAGRVGATVGPNVALADDEEVLFLLEVA